MNKRTKKLIGGVAALAVFAAAGVAGASWLASGSGSGNAKARSAQALFTADASGDATADLYPGAVAGLKVRITNPNPYAVDVQTISPNGAVTADSGHSGCVATGVSFATQSGSWIVNAGQTLPVTLPGSVSMSNLSDNGCQGATFDIPVMFSGVSYVPDTTGPTVASVQLLDGDGTREITDEIRITFSEPLKASTMCSLWTNDTVNQSITGDGVIGLNVANNGNDDILTVGAVVPGPCAGGFKLGTIRLGADWTTGGATFFGFSQNQVKLFWTPGSSLLRIVLGSGFQGDLHASVAAGTVTFTPVATLTDVAGNPIVTTPFTAANQRI